MSGSLLQWVPIVALLVFGTLFLRHIATFNGVEVLDALSRLTFWQWGGALICTALSFRAIGSYDLLVHSALGTGQSPSIARAAGMKAIAVSQTLGFGTLTSALVRWRCLSDVMPSAILRLSVLVSLSFLAALAAITALVVQFLGLVSQSNTLLWIGAGALIGLMAIVRIAHRRGWIPRAVGARTLLALLIATGADTLFAALALWLLWPDAVSFHLLFAAYLMALGAGLLSNAPSGIGAFDLTLLALLGATTDAQAMAAVLAFRVIYYAIPTAVALLGLWHTRPLLRAHAHNHPEAALVFQSAIPFAHSQGNMLTLPCWRNGAILGDLPDAMTLEDLRRQTDLKALYKCSAKQAIAARTAGWSVIRCARDALIVPQQWSTNRPDTRQLRRALAAFERSNITLREVTDPEILRPVATQWVASHGGEKGHSMGRFCPTYLRQQRVFAAFDQDTPVAFASFHTGPVWTLDLMRHTANIPKGTMHALVQAAIHSARDTGVQTLSLASVATPPRNFPFGAKITARCAGLKRFKSSFAPQWHPRYLCAGGPIHLLMVMITLAFRIRWPGPLPDPNFIQRHHEDFSFAQRRAPCEPLISPIGDADHDEYSFRPSRVA